jgi:hypothetical protein
MPLLHVQHGPLAARDGDLSVDPRGGHEHMFCAPAGDALDRAARGAGLAPPASATVLYADRGRRRPGAGLDWSLVLTSDI